MVIFSKTKNDVFDERNHYGCIKYQGSIVFLKVEENFENLCKGLKVFLAPYDIIFFISGNRRLNSITSCIFYGSGQDEYQLYLGQIRLLARSTGPF